MENSMRERHLITGGAGYVGRRLALHLAKAGVEVIIVDQTDPDLLYDQTAGGRVVFKWGDVTDLATIADHFKGVSAVYHLASYGMSGKEQFFPDKIKQVNIEGTNNVIKACLMSSVQRLVYTSTFNVVFFGEPIENGDESLPYRNLEKQPWDSYACSKTCAEQAVLSASGTVLPSGRMLSSCALRLAGIYGPGEQRHIPRVASIMSAGLLVTCIGRNPITEFVHLDNVVSALSLAEQALTSRRNHVAAGQAYFLSDGKPIDSYEFFRPLADALDVRLPSSCIPVWLAYYVGFLVEILYRLLHGIYDFYPLISRAEVYKIGVTHYFSVEKARKQLLYEPLYQNDMSDVAKLYRQQRLASKGSMLSSRSRTANTWRSSLKSQILNIMCCLAFVCLLLSLLPATS